MGLGVTSQALFFGLAAGQETLQVGLYSLGDGREMEGDGREVEGDGREMDGDVVGSGRRCWEMLGNAERCWGHPYLTCLYRWACTA